WASIWEKKLYRASAEAMTRFKVWASPKVTISCGENCRRIRSAAHCALNNSTWAAVSAAVRRLTSTCFLTPGTIYNSFSGYWNAQVGIRDPGSGIRLCEDCFFRFLRKRHAAWSCDLNKVYTVNDTLCKLLIRFSNNIFGYWRGSAPS